MFHVEPGRSECSTWNRLSLQSRPCENPPPRHPSMISLARYAALLAAPDLAATVLASLIGRLPIGITGLAVLLLAQSTSGSFARAGVTTAGYIAGLATLAPVLGRLIDRGGPRRVLVACGVLYPLSLTALVASIAYRAPAWLPLALAVAAGASFPPITVCMRTFLKQRLGNDPLLATAYSLESVLIETIFIVGPMLVALVRRFRVPFSGRPVRGGLQRCRDVHVLALSRAGAMEGRAAHGHEPVRAVIRRRAFCRCWR